MSCYGIDAGNECVTWRCTGVIVVDVDDGVPFDTVVDTTEFNHDSAMEV